MKADLKIFTDLVTRFFRPVAIASQGPTAAKMLLLQLGYVPPAQLKVFENLAANINGLLNLVESISQITEEEIEQNPELIITNIRNGIQLITGVINDIQNLPSVLESELIGSELLAQTDILEALPGKLFDLMTVEFLKNNYNRTYSLLKLFGVIEVKGVTNPSNPFNFPHIERTVHWDRLLFMVTDPLDLLKQTIRDNDQYFYSKALHLIQELGLSFGLFPNFRFPDMEVMKFINNDPLIDTWPHIRFLEILRFPLIPGQFDGLAIDIYPLIDRVQDKFRGLVLVFVFDPGIKEFDISEKLKLELDFSGSLAGGLGVMIDENDQFTFATDLFTSPQTMADNVQFDFTAKLSKKPVAAGAEEEKFLQIGNPEGNRFEVGSFRAAFGVEKKQSTRLYFESELLDGLIVMKFDEADGFISKVVGKGIESNFNVGAGFSNRQGFYFTGSSGLEITLPTHISIGPLEIQNLQISLKAENVRLKLAFASSLKITLGPLIVVIQNIGLVLPGKENFGSSGPAIGFKPPTGAGLTVDAGGIKGGGVLNFDPDKGEYFGALELEFKDLFSLKAFGIINTKFPDGSKNFSLLIIITAEFSPVQLGFGFTLNGVGGLLGVNRTTKVEVLKEGLKTNMLKSILFPEDVVANINRIVSDIKQVFPSQNDHFLICPMGKIGWGTPTIISLELGILIEIPARGFKILGVLKAVLPEEENPLLKLQVNFLGDIDFENRSISFDARLYDSKILTFTLTGQMALRLSFGDNPVLIISVGGFHPAFKEVPADLKNMERITISLYDGPNARIIIQTYFAITSNTAQFGAKAELYAEKGSFNIYGFVSYDVLFQFRPFKFIADFGAGVALRRNSSVIMSIRVSGQLSGPKPWDAKGEASVSFFFFSISVPFHVTWGEASNEAPAEKEDVLALLADAIQDNRNWKSEVPPGNKIHVSIRSIPAEPMPVHPFGVVTFSEQIVPLEVAIKKFGNKLPKNATTFEIKVNDAQLKTDEAREQFAPANFFEMKDAEKLSRPSFERMKSGFKVTGSAAVKAPPHIVSKSVDYEFNYLGKTRKPRPDKYVIPGLFFKASTKSAAVSQAAVSHQNNRVSMNAPQKVAVLQEQFVVANISDMKLHSEGLKAASYTEALLEYDRLISINPALKEQIQVVSAYEVI